MQKKVKARYKTLEVCDCQVILKNIWNEKVFVKKFYNQHEADAFFQSIFSYFSLPQEIREGCLWQKLDEERG